MHIINPSGNNIEVSDKKRKASNIVGGISEVMKRKMTDKSEIILYEKNIYKALYMTAYPLVLSDFIIALLDITDTFFVGHMENSSAAQAGMGLAWPVINIMLAINNGLAAAGVAIISRMSGEKDFEGAGQQAGLLVSVSLIAGIVINAVLFLMAPEIIGFMGAESDVFFEASAYLRISSFEMIPLFVFTAFTSICQSEGDMIRPVILSIVAAFVNIVLAAVLVMGFGFGIKGAAGASVAGQLCIVPFYIKALFAGKGKLVISVSDMRINMRGLTKLYKIAGPAVYGQLAASFGFIILQMIILKEGKEISAAFSIGNKISNIILAVVMALATTMSAFVGQNIGAKNKERAEKAYRTSRNASVIIMLAGLIILFPIRRWLVNFMSNDENTVTAAVSYIAVVLVTLPGLALYQNYMCVFNGSGNTRFSFALSFIWLWLLRIPMLLAVGKLGTFGAYGTWFAMGASNVLAAVAGHFLYGHINYE